ncbi:hypothetical protein ZWY2020_022550 [Hordeum vulgare]|nr:hypothetical protein ZWY2020_022550 [Hordeum vulgare]
MVKDMNYEDMAQMDFCQVIVETIQAGAIDWQKMKKGGRGNKDHLYGLAHGPVIMYLDSLLLPNTREMNRIAKKMNNSSTPRANYLVEKDLKKIAKEDMKKDGKGRPDDYEFGKIEARLDKKQQTSATEFGSSSDRLEDKEKQQGVTTNEVTSSSDRSEDEEKQQVETTNEEILERAVQSQTQDEVAPGTDVQVSKMTVEDKLETIFPQKEIPLDAEFITTMTDGQVLQEQEMHHATPVEAGSHEVCKSHQGYTEFEFAPNVEIHCYEMAVDDKVVEPVLSQQEITVQTERNATTTDEQEKAIIAMEQQGSPITGDQEQYLEKTGSPSSSSIDEEEEVRFQGAAHVKISVEVNKPAKNYSS